MKKLLICIILFAILFCACENVRDDSHIPNSSKEQVGSSDVITTTADVPPVIEPIEKEPQQTAATNSPPTINSPDDEELPVYVSCLKEYVQAGNADNTVTYLYEASQTVETLPILGPELQETDHVAYFFYQGNTLLGGTTLSIQKTELMGQISYTAYNPDQLIVKTFSDQHCINMFKQCKEKHPDFELLGFVFNTVGYPTIYPIGIAKGESTVKYLFGSELHAFDCVEPFSTLEEGRKAFINYLKEKATLLSELSIFEWSGDHLITALGYLNKYRHQDVLLENRTQEEMEYLWDQDDYIFIPLMNSNLEEDMCAVHLLFYRGNLIAELVLEEKDKAFVSVWQNVAKKDENGEYIPLTTIHYQDVVNAAKTAYPDKEICGVIFENGDYVPYYLDGETVVRCTK